MSFAETLWAALVLFAVSATAFAAWHDPKVYLRIFWIPAAILFLAALAFGGMSTVYGWGWNDAVDIVLAAHPQAADTIQFRTGEKQSFWVLGIVLGVAYILIMAFIADLRRRSNEDGEKADGSHEPKA